jgi:hypothetical protein
MSFGFARMSVAKRVEMWYRHGQDGGDNVMTHAELDAVLDRTAALSRADWPALVTISPIGAQFGPVLQAGFHVALGTLFYSGDDDREEATAWATDCRTASRSSTCT